MFLQYATGIYRQSDNNQVCGGWEMENDEHTYRICTAEHESNLATGIRRDGTVGIVHHRE